jgi:hypothetical protein
MEDDVDLVVICLPSYQHNVCSCFSAHQGSTTISKDIDLYTYFGSLNGYSNSKTS